jgi:hypothetical protein
MAAVSFLGKTSAAAAPADAEAVKDGQVDIPSTVPSSEASDVSPEVSPPPEKRGFDIVTLGCLTNEQMLPAFGSTKNRSLIALLSGSPEKRRFGRQYGWSSDALDDYSQPERLKERDDGKVVYIVLPESMHNELILRLSTINNNVFCQRLWSKRKLIDGSHVPRWHNRCQPRATSRLRQPIDQLRHPSRIAVGSEAAEARKINHS